MGIVDNSQRTKIAKRWRALYQVNHSMPLNAELERGSRAEMPRRVAQSFPSPARATAWPCWPLLFLYTTLESLVNTHHSIMPEQAQRRQEPEASVRSSHCWSRMRNGIIGLTAITITDDQLVWLQGRPPRSRYLLAGAIRHQSILW